MHRLGLVGLRTVACGLPRDLCRPCASFSPRGLPWSLPRSPGLGLSAGARLPCGRSSPGRAVDVRAGHVRTRIDLLVNACLLDSSLPLLSYVSASSGSRSGVPRLLPRRSCLRPPWPLSPWFRSLRPCFLPCGVALVSGNPFLLVAFGRASRFSSMRCEWRSSIGSTLVSMCLNVAAAS